MIRLAHTRAVVTLLSLWQSYGDDFMASGLTLVLNCNGDSKKTLDSFSFSNDLTVSHICIQYTLCWPEHTPNLKNRPAAVPVVASGMKDSY